MLLDTFSLTHAMKGVQWDPCNAKGMKQKGLNCGCFALAHLSLSGRGDEQSPSDAAGAVW